MAGHHEHGHIQTDDSRRLIATLALILGFMAVEVVVGLLASSLALLSDALHMLTDAAAIALALFAARSPRARPAATSRSAFPELRSCRRARTARRS